jgi:DNA mismatch repair protein MSH6
MKSISSLLLDGQTLINLEIFQNSSNGSESGTLFKLLNHCITPFGKRLFRRWTCHPLRKISDINNRLDAIDDLYNNTTFVEELSSKLKKLPDLERVIARIHSGNCLVKDFVTAIEAFNQVKDLFKDKQDYIQEFNSSYLKNLTNIKFNEKLLESLKYFENAFDHKDAYETGKIRLFEGYDNEFDLKKQAVCLIETKLSEYLKECQKKLGCKIIFKDIGKEIYQMEVPTKQKVPRDWTVMSKTVQVNRYYTDYLCGLINELLVAKEVCDMAMREIKSKIYQKFDQSFNDWYFAL